MSVLQTASLLAQVRPAAVGPPRPRHFYSVRPCRRVTPYTFAPQENARNPPPNEDPAISAALAAGATAVTGAAASRYAEDPRRARRDVEVASRVANALVVRAADNDAADGAVFIRKHSQNSLTQDGLEAASANTRIEIHTTSTR